MQVGDTLQEINGTAYVLSQVNQRKKDGIWYTNEFVLELEFVEYLFLAIVEGIQWEDEEPFDIEKYLDIVDWLNVPVDTKVLVRDGDNYPWKNTYIEHGITNEVLKIERTEE